MKLLKKYIYTHIHTAPLTQQNKLKNYSTLFQIFLFLLLLMTITCSPRAAFVVPFLCFLQVSTLLWEQNAWKTDNSPFSKTSKMVVCRRALTAGGSEPGGPGQGSHERGYKSLDSVENSKMPFPQYSTLLQSKTNSTCMILH